MIPLLWSILAAQTIYFRGSTTSTIQLRCGRPFKADWTIRQIRSVKLRSFASVTPYAHRKTRRLQSTLLDWSIFAKNWSDLLKPSPMKQWKLTSSLPCQRYLKRLSRYSSNKSQFQRHSRLWTVYEKMLIEPSSPKRSETSRPDPLSTVTAEDMASTEEEEILAETTEMTIQNTAACTAKWTIILPKAVAFSNDSTAKAEALTERRARKCSASTAENLAIPEPNAAVVNEVSKPKTKSTNEALKTQCRKRIRHWHSMECLPVIEISFDYQTPLTLPSHLHDQLLHLRRRRWTQELLTTCATIEATSSHTTDCHLRLL